MSIVKIDLSMSSVDRNELYCIIDSTELVNKFDLSDLNKLIEDNDDIWWTGEAEEYFEKELGFVVASSGNTYNNESDLSNILQWSIMMPAAGEHAPELYNKGILLVQFHRGGDARGNYGKVKVYKWNGEDDFFFLESCAGWYMADLNKKHIDTSFSQRFEIGYCQNPTYELNKHIVKILELTDDEAKVELDNGETVIVSPYHSADFA